MAHELTETTSSMTGPPAWPTVQSDGYFPFSSLPELQLRAAVGGDFPFPHRFVIVLASGGPASVGGGGRLDESTENSYIPLLISSSLNKLGLDLLAFSVAAVHSSRLRLVRGFGGLFQPGAGPVHGGERRGRRVRGAGPLLHLAGVRYGIGEALVCCILAGSGSPESPLVLTSHGNPLSGCPTPQSTPPRCPDGEAYGTTAARCPKRAASPTPEPTVPLLVVPATELAGGCSTPNGISVTGNSNAGYSRFNRLMVALAPAFMPNCTPMVDISDLNGTNTGIQEGSELGSHVPGGYFQHSSDYSFPEEIQRQIPMSPNFLYASGSAPYAPFEAPQPWMAKATSSDSEPKQGTTRSALDKQAAPVVDVGSTDDNGGNPSTLSKKDAGGSRAGRRMIWTSDETMRLAFYEADSEEGGCKKAKDERSGKGKGKGSSSTMDEIDKLRECQAKSKEDHIEVLNRHQQIAADKKESARLIHLAAQEKKEAKLLEKEGKMHDKESKLLETYKSLLTFDTSQMSEDLRAEHMIAVKSMREKIFANRAS
ncbi:hypothetical protein C2845_PM05G32240 [Panicum miliaceum]|uniref:No apical meristem-associated C-terminal domain-containing protein n=1 Tax=Panicum miliaceum TaxID=4540 RepID=A0A3L6SZ75_PANMI|nr:hypothetical protein C2845_PM05G32240 [Panicum miliaceum]